MLIPILVFYILFRYGPMTRIVIAFQDYKVFKGIAGSKFVGLKNFETFFKSKDCWRLIRNTLLLSAYSIVFHFPLPILLAIMLNEVRHSGLKRTMQTISYMPHFISVVVICGLLRNFCASSGIINAIISFFNRNHPAVNLLSKPEYYRGVEIEATLLPKIQIDIVVSKVPVRSVIEVAKKVLYTGHIGDGKIFVYDVENIVKVRTGEEGYDALQDVE